MKLTSPLRSLIFILVFATATFAQTSLNYGFVSPNTKENLKLEDAMKGMTSKEETALVKQSINLGCVVRSRIRAFRALGSWSDGAEPSVMVRVQSDEATVRYLLSRLGRAARQKSVLYFYPTPDGTAQLYTLQPRTRDLTALTNALERAGIEFRTLVPLKSGTWIYIVDLKRELGAKVRAAAKRLRAGFSTRSGNAAFIDAYDEEIRGYETKNPNLPPACDAQKKPK
ncbi:MAG TPA: hypothetical protein VFZ22_10080 [Pyrinomonadaceae bacterium]|nr:hypothetical protein [Pyrinomonadaceae bacterium]